MINSILTEAKQYLESDAFDKDLSIVANQCSLSEDDMGYVSSVLSDIIMGNIPEDKFVEDLKSVSEIKNAQALSIYKAAKEKILDPFKKKIAHLVVDHVQNSTPLPSTSSLSTPMPEHLEKPSNTQDKLLRSETATSLPKPSIHSLEKSDILSHIENPPHTVIKKYVIEHEVITDPEHLIDDSVDQRARLEAHYKD
jgi:hypothetical protein